MAPAVGKVQMAWKRSDVRAARRASAWADCTLRWAMEWERLHDRLGEWIEATEVRGVPLAQWLGITIPPRPLPTDPTETEFEGSDA